MHEQPAPGVACPEVGATAPAGDGCNECTCVEEGWACTLKLCADPAACEVGEVKEDADGCNTCTCVEGGTWACTDMACTGESCTSGSQKPSADGCNTCTCTDGDWACTERACATECTPGDSKPAEDGCNTCGCQDDGTWACTLIACGPEEECPPAADLGDDVVCAQVIAYGRLESGVCCMYPTPCQVPEGMDTFYSVAECEAAGATACGGWLGDTCSETEYCAYEEGQLCGAADASAVCKPRPDACTKESAPVCGCDGTTYGNACAAAAAGTGVLSNEACPSQ